MRWVVVITQNCGTLKHLTRGIDGSPQTIIRWGQRGLRLHLLVWRNVSQGFGCAELQLNLGGGVILGMLISMQAQKNRQILARSLIIYWLYM